MLKPSPPGPRALHSSRVFLWRRQLGSWILLPLALAAILSGRYWLEGSARDDIIDGLSVALLIAGVALRSWATLYIGGHKSQKLITEGVLPQVLGLP
ncbi:MAG: hypothetical protein O3A20_09910 [Planctomycetota bacterium]|nr:hypothetical protein [Planctomycetota bacterium]